MSEIPAVLKQKFSAKRAKGIFLITVIITSYRNDRFQNKNKKLRNSASRSCK
jgi:hypothetical protein